MTQNDGVSAAFAPEFAAFDLGQNVSLIACIVSGDEFRKLSRRIPMAALSNNIG